MTEQHTRHDPSEFHWFADQTVEIKDFPVEDYVLDIGGGGEGVIGALMGRRVISIDPNLRELEEAEDGPLKIVMDARELKFPDESFSDACAFFTFMYIDPGDHRAVLAEIHRVLKPGGTLRIWEMSFPPRGGAGEEIVAFHLKVKLPGRTIETGYGTRWRDVELGLKHYRNAAAQVGFELKNVEQSGETFVLILKKPV